MEIKRTHCSSAILISITGNVEDLIYIVINIVDNWGKHVPVTKIGILVMERYTFFMDRAIYSSLQVFTSLYLLNFKDKTVIYKCLNKSVYIVGRIRVKIIETIKIAITVKVSCVCVCVCVCVWFATIVHESFL